MNAKPLRSMRLTITTTVLETSHGAGGPAALLHWADAVGHATVAVRCAWSSRAAVGLAEAEAGDTITVAGTVTETRRSPWLPGETLVMTAEAVKAPQPACSQKAKQ